MLPKQLKSVLQEALQNFRYLEALALLFHAIVEDGATDLFAEARGDLNKNLPGKEKQGNEIDRLAGLLSVAAHRAEPFADTGANPLLLASALARHLGENFPAIANRMIRVQDRQYHAFPQPNSRLAKEWASPRKWFHPVWFVQTTFHGKTVCIDHMDWHGEEKPVCALIEFDDGVNLDLELKSDTFIVRGLSDESKRWNSIEAALKAAGEAGAQILVLAELSLTPTLLEKLEDWLLKESHSFRIIAAGSYHHHEPETKATVMNRMEVMDGSGELLLFHDKCFEFDHPEIGRECLSPGKKLHLLHVPPGLLAFAICKDFCQAGGMDWKALPLDGICVASMGDKTTISAHQAAARDMKLAGIRVLLANITKDSNGAHPGFFSQHNGDPQSNTGNVTIRQWNEERNGPPGKPQFHVVK